jgi:hypothetical protein
MRESHQVLSQWQSPRMPSARGTVSDMKGASRVRARNERGVAWKEAAVRPVSPRSVQGVARLNTVAIIFDQIPGRRDASHLYP